MFFEQFLASGHIILVNVDAHHFSILERSNNALEGMACRRSNVQNLFGRWRVSLSNPLVGGFGEVLRVNIAVDDGGDVA